jgi:hypothetical protein
MLYQGFPIWGLNGYAYWQTTDDEIDGDKVKDNKVSLPGPGILMTTRTGFRSSRCLEIFKNRPEGFTGVLVVYA